MIKDGVLRLGSIGCINYYQSTIFVSCNGANLTDINTIINNSSLISKQSSKVWFLNTNIEVKNGSNLYINSTDVDWLKINSTAGVSHYIKASGNLLIDSVKITGWDTIHNSYSKVNSNGTVPRSYIITKHGAGTTNITNSEIAFLGYDHAESYGLTYSSGSGSRIDNNKIHNLQFGFYSQNKVHDILVENNLFYDNVRYGIDPHSGTHDLVIKNNTVYNNGKHGIICSDHCYNIAVESNKVFNNHEEGIMLHKNTSNSIIKNNYLYGNRDQIVLHVNSSNNKVYNNTINGGKVGIRVNTGSSNNLIDDNTIKDSDYGIYVLQGASNNTIDSNKIIGTTKSAIYIQDNNTENNTFSNNILVDNKISVKYSNTGTKSNQIFNNTMGNTTLG